MNWELRSGWGGLLKITGLTVLTGIMFIMTLTAFTLKSAGSALHPEYLFPEQEKHLHNSQVAELSNGNALSCWSEGSGLSTAILYSSRGKETVEGQTNAEKLGFPKGKKVLLMHMDDLGMCREANDAGKYYIENGYVLSGAVMMPCEYAEPFVKWAVTVPEADIGVHLTLTSEWKTWRWGTLTEADQVPGLLDPQGKMWRSVPEVVKNATPQEVEVEIRAQIDKMMELGYKPTHIDTHMGTLYGSPEFLKVFLKVSEEYRIPANAIDLSNPKVAAFYKAEGYPINEEVIGMLANYSLPRLDNFGSVPKGSSYQEVKDNFMNMVKLLDAGLTEIIFHPSFKTENLATITGSWQQRVWEAEMFADQEIIDFFRDHDIILTTWREVMERFDKY
jgi:chitin disaccharide deacetylase